MAGQVANGILVLDDGALALGPSALSLTVAVIAERLVQGVLPVEVDQTDHIGLLPSDGPYAHGDRVFVWIDDKAKYKAVGRWARARVISQNGAIVTVEIDKAMLRVNQSKVRRDYDPWHDVPLPWNIFGA